MIQNSLKTIFRRLTKQFNAAFDIYHITGTTFNPQTNAMTQQSEVYRITQGLVSSNKQSVNTAIAAKLLSQTFDYGGNIQIADKSFVFQPDGYLKNLLLNEASLSKIYVIYKHQRYNLTGIAMFMDSMVSLGGKLTKDVPKYEIHDLSLGDKLNTSESYNVGP